MYSIAFRTVSNSIIKLHGGHIGVYSEGEGSGSTTFYIDVPIVRIEKSEAELAAMEEAASTAPSGGASSHSFSAMYLRMLSHSDDSSHHTARILTPSILKNNRSSSKTTTATVSSSAHSGSSSQAVPAPGSPHYRARLESIGDGDGDIETGGAGGSAVGCDVSAEVIKTFSPEKAKKGSQSSNESNKSHLSNKSGIAGASSSSAVGPSEDPRRYFHKSVLIVDDSTTNRKLVNRLLRDKMGTRDEARDGLDALNQVKKAMSQNFRYDVILMDYMMPEMDGPTATREIRALGYTG